MKKVYLLALLCCMISSVWAQTAVNPLLPSSMQPIPMSSNLFHHQQGGSNRAATTISVDYANLEFLRHPTTASGFLWELNKNYILNIPPSTPADTADLYTIRWAAVKFDSIVDTDNDVAYNKANFTSMKVDSISFTVRHNKVSASTVLDTIYLTIYEAAATTTGLTFVTGTGNNLNYTPNNNVLWRDTFILNASLAPTTSSFIVPVQVGAGVGVTVPQGKGFVVKLDYSGPKADVFEIGDYGNFACGTNGYPGTSVIPNNSSRWLNLWINNTNDFRGIIPPGLTGQPAGCDKFYFQNVAIGAVVTFNTGTVASCPGAATGTPEYRPAYNSFTCINQSTAYSAQLTFEVPATYSSIPITSVKIDSIRNLPCGITYTLDHVNGIYTGGSTGCITFSGTTTAPVGGYKLKTYATITTGAGTSPSTDISTLGIAGYEYFLRVIANGASTCPTVASGSAGLTGGCSVVTPPTAAPTATPSTICRGASTTLNANASGGTSPYTYAWSASGGAATPSAVASPTVNPTATTTYTVTVTATGGATATGSVTVTVNAAPSATISGATSICSGGSTTLSAPAGLSYLWSNSSTSQTINVTTAGTYSVTTTQNGCTATSSVNVTVGNPSATITPSGPTSFCPGGSVTLSAPAGYTYQWTGGSTGQTLNVTTAGTYSVTVSAGAGCSATSSTSVTVFTAPSATITPSGPTSFCSGGSVTLSAPAGLTYSWSNSTSQQTINVTQAGTYSVTVTNANNCTATSSITVSVNSSPSATITPNGPTTFCTGGNVTLSAVAGLTYTWSSNAGSVTTQNVTVNQSGTYSVTVSNGTCTATSSVVVSVVSSPSATITPNGPTTFCTGGNVILSAPSGYNYAWSANAGNATTQTVTVTAAGTYNVTVSAGASCTATSSISVTVNTPPTVTISTSGPTSFCTGGSVTLTASNGASYLWSNGSTQSSIVANQPGTYIVTVTSANTCSNTAQVTVNVVSTPSATITPAGSTTICPGSSVNLSAPAGYTYQWSNGATTETVSATLPGTYSVTVSAGGTCTATSSTTVALHSAPSAVVTPAGPVAICAGDVVTLTAPAGLQYVWSNGSTSQSITPTLAGTYSVTVTNANNCTASSAPVTVTASNAPAKPVVTNNNNVLSSSTATSYQWYRNGAIIPNATGQTFTPTQSGTYKVVITNVDGCSNESDAVSVTIVGISNVNNDLTITVNPNPSNGMFYITTGNFTGTFNITVLDMAGREVMTETVNGQLVQHPLDMSLVGDGVYILRLSNGEAVNFTRLVVY
ncbi:hypothetical protein BH09BAC1_BH09BAC1_16650 [soil metagenome]